jgi:hypothetical protein
VAESPSSCRPGRRYSLSPLFTRHLRGVGINTRSCWGFGVKLRQRQRRRQRHLALPYHPNCFFTHPTLPRRYIQYLVTDQRFRASKNDEFSATGVRLHPVKEESWNHTCGELRSQHELERSAREAGSQSMASSYALPASAITHSHHGHGHGHSHSLSPSRHSANTPRPIRQERSNGSLHAYAISESHLGHINEHAHSHNRGQGHNHDREQSPSPYAKSPYFEPIEPPPPSLCDDPFGMTGDLPIQQTSYQPPVATAHGHQGHTYTTSAEPRSRFTSFVLPYVLRWPLIHTIMADKDSRRIFYFMRCVTVTLLDFIRKY